MKIKTREQFDEFIENYEEIVTKVAELATLKLKIKGTNCIVSDDEITIEGNEFNTETHISLGCGDYDTYYTTVTFDDLFDENFVENANIQIEEEKRKAEEERKRVQLRQLERLRERERAQYLKLKEKYGDEIN